MAVGLPTGATGSRASGAGAPLERRDVLLSAGCETSGQAITFTSACMLTVADRGGTFRLGSPARRAELINMRPALRLTLVLRNTPISRSMDRGKAPG